MTHPRSGSIACALVLALAVALPAAGPAQAQGDDVSLGWLAARVEERAELMAERIEDEGERRADQAAAQGSRFLAEHIRENAEQEADNVEKTGRYLATCIELGAVDCGPHGYAWELIPEEYGRLLFEREPGTEPSGR